MINGLLADVGNSQQTFQSWDTIDGGGGINTLNVQNNGANLLTPTLANIQRLNMVDTTAAGAAVTLNVNGLSTLTNMSLNGNAAGSAYTINNLGSLPSITLTGTGAASTLNFTSAALTPAGQTLNLTLSGVVGGAGLTLSDTGTNALEAIAIASTGSANNVGAFTVTNLGATTLTASGDQNLTLTVTDATAAGATLKTVNASSMTGQLAITAVADSTVTGGSGNDTITSGGGSVNSFTGGTGNDTFVFAANPLVRNTTVAGGEGTLDILSAAVASITGFTTALPATNISGIESLDLSTAMAADTITLSNVQAGISDVNIAAAGAGQTGTIVFDSGVAGNIDVGAGVGGVVVATLGNFTVQSAGTGSADSITIDNDTAGSDIIAGNITATGVETLTIDGTTTTTLAVQAGTRTITLTPSVVGSATTVNFIGNNSFGAAGNTLGAITATNINASGLGVAIDGTRAAIVMGAGSTTTTGIIGSAGNDTLLTGAATATSIDGGAGNDTITANGQANDTLRGGEGNDSITGATGNDDIDGGAGADTVIFASGELTANDTVNGGEGTADILQYTTYAAAADNVASAQSRVSNFEILRLDDTGAAGVAVALSNYTNNAGFTQIRLGTQTVNTDGYAFTNVSSTLNTIAIVAAATAGPAAGIAGTHSFARLVDTSTDSLTVRNANTGNANGAAAIINGLTALDEETISITEVPGTAVAAGSNDLTITTLTVSDLTTLNITSASDVIITNAIVGATALATVNASAATGAVTVNASASLVAVNMTSNANSTAITTFTGGTVADSITGSGGDDALSGGAGADTIIGNAGADVITGGTGSDSMTGGAGADDYNQAGQVAATAVNADVITDFSVTGGDQIGAWSIGNMETFDVPLTAAALDLVLAGNAATSIAAAQAFVFATVTAAYDLGTAALASALIVDGNFSSTTLATALEVGGSRALTANGAFAAGDGFYVVYDDGANTYFSLLTTNAIVADDATFGAGSISITNLVTLTGVSDATTIAAANTIAFVA